MVFSSLYFLYLFLPVCLLCYGLSPSLTVKNLTLTVFSLIFYAWGEPTYIILLLISVLCNYLFGLGIGGFQKHEKPGGAKAVMILSLIFVSEEYAESELPRNSSTIFFRAPADENALYFSLSSV